MRLLWMTLSKNLSAMEKSVRPLYYPQPALFPNFCNARRLGHCESRQSFPTPRSCYAGHREMYQGCRDAFSITLVDGHISRLRY